MTLEEMFDVFYKAYPKKKGKAEALKAFLKLKPDEELLNTILRVLEKQKNHEDWVKDKRKYMPYPATYLNKKRWEDEIEGEQACRDDAENKAFGTYL